jgi:addiction module HigA family antidote
MAKLNTYTLGSSARGIFRAYGHFSVPALKRHWDSSNKSFSILKGNRRITADTALRLSKYFGTSAKFWLGLQDDFDLEEESQAKKEELKAIPSIQNAA